MREYAPLNDKLLPDGSNVSGVLAAIENGKKKEIENQLAKYFKLIPEKDITKVYTELVGKFGADAMLYVECGQDRHDHVKRTIRKSSVIRGA